MGAGPECGAERGWRQHPHTRGQLPEPRHLFRGTVRGRWSSTATVQGSWRGGQTGSRVTSPTGIYSVESQSMKAPPRIAC